MIQKSNNQKKVLCVMLKVDACAAAKHTINYHGLISANLNEAGNFEKEIVVINWEQIYSAKNSQLNFLLAYMYPAMPF